MYCWWQVWGARWTEILCHPGESSQLRMDTSYLSAAPSSSGVTPVGRDHSWDCLTPWAQEISVSSKTEEKVKQATNLENKEMNRQPNEIYSCWPGLFNRQQQATEADSSWLDWTIEFLKWRSFVILIYCNFLLFITPSSDFSFSSVSLWSFHNPPLPIIPLTP